MKPTLYVLIGPPASGKTTLARKLVPDERRILEGFKSPETIREIEILLTAGFDCAVCEYPERADLLCFNLLMSRISASLQILRLEFRP
jgi:hypothetical protein